MGREYDVILPIGISGSGKTRWRNAMHGYTVVCPDEIRRELTGNISDQSRNKDVFQIAYGQIGLFLFRGEKVIMDATNIDTRSRKELVNYIKTQCSKPDGTAIRIGYKLFPADIDLSEARINKDLEDGKDRSRVNREVLEKQYRKYVGTLESLPSEDIENIEGE